MRSVDLHLKQLCLPCLIAVASNVVTKSMTSTLSYVNLLWDDAGFVLNLRHKNTHLPICVSFYSLVLNAYMTPAVHTYLASFTTLNLHTHFMLAAI